MKRHADILAEYVGYKRACWYTIVCGLLMGAAALYTDLAAWPVAVLSVSEFGGGGLFILWKLRHIKPHARQLEHPIDGTTR